MAEKVPGNRLIDRLDGAPLNGRFWAMFAVLAAQFTFEYFDFFIVGYLVAIVGPQWKLTFGQSSIILLSAGLGAIAGSLIFGRLADVWGRKPVIVTGTLLYSLCAGAVALIPDGAWVLFSLLRFAVGIGLGAASTAQVALIVENTPTRYRTVLSSAMNAPVAIGVFIAALSSAALVNQVGWRGLAAIGSFPVIIAGLVAIVVPESIRWLMVKDHLERARENLGWLLKADPSGIPAVALSGKQPEEVGFGELYQHRTMFWFTILVWLCMATAVNGILQWGPTIVALLLKIPPAAAARYFVVMSVAGFVMRIPFIVLAQKFGRRFCGMLAGYTVGASLIIAGFGHDAFFAGISVFLVLLILAYAFTDAGFGNLSPYSAEIWPVSLAARGVGLAQAANGVGKIVGPLILALIAGTSNVVTPQATEAAAAPGFILLGACAALTGLAFTVVRIEPHGKPLALGVEASEPE